MNAARLAQRHQELQAIRGRNFFKTHQVLECAGSGNHLVFKVRCKESGELRAIKEMAFNPDDEIQDTVLSEIALLEKIGVHPNIIKYHESCVLEKQVDEYQTLNLAFILMEFAEYGNLFELVEERQYYKECITYNEVENFLEQSLEALSFLQQKQIAHCDIKPENVLLFQKNPPIFKICDIGSGKTVTSSHIYTVLENGTLPFMSPELMASQKNRTKINPYISDVFSLGLVLIYICSQKRFTSEERSEQMNDIQILHQGLKDMIDSFRISGITEFRLKLLREFSYYLVVVNPQERLGFSDLKNLWVDFKNKQPEIHAFLNFNDLPNSQFKNNNTMAFDEYQKNIKKDLRQSGFIESKNSKSFIDSSLYSRKGKFKYHRSQDNQQNELIDSPTKIKKLLPIGIHNLEFESVMNQNMQSESFYTRMKAKFGILIQPKIIPRKLQLIVPVSTDEKLQLNIEEKRKNPILEPIQDKKLNQSYHSYSKSTSSSSPGKNKSIPLRNQPKCNIQDISEVVNTIEKQKEQSFTIRQIKISDPIKQNSQSPKKRNNYSFQL